MHMYIHIDLAWIVKGKKPQTFEHFVPTGILFSALKNYASCHK